MSENSEQARWYEHWEIQAFVATVWINGFVFNVAWSTWPTSLRIISGLACAGLAILAGSQVRQYWRRDREVARRRASAPDIERIP